MKAKKLEIELAMFIDGPIEMVSFVDALLSW